MKSFSVDLTGKVAVVTGGGGVLCGSMAKALASQGAAVAVLDLRKEAADAVAEEIIAAGGKAVGVACNVLDKASIEAACSEVESTLGSCDILVNGAGGNHPKGTTSKEFLFPEDLTADDADTTTFFDLDPKGIEFVFGLNFIGTLLPTQVFSRAMAEKGVGTIVNVSSMNAFTPLTKIPAYSAAKAAVSNFTQWLAVHMSKVGLRVNAIAPGFFLTEQNRALLTNADGGYTPRAEKILGQTPMGRFGAPEELLGTLLWLVCDEASGFVTGTVVAVDGGFSAYSGV
ncbi:MAG: SDR family oxidoreductase [Lentisphaeria bacterium]|nr:SDR family oxidoreductase [Lentisphaeria bacterium]